MIQPSNFAHAERAPYEFGRLLRALPRHLHAADLTGDQANMAKAAALHASNYRSTLLSGLESIGRFIWSAAHNNEQSVEADDFANVGMLVSGLAVQLQFLNEFRSEVDELTIHTAAEGQSK